MTDPSTTEFTKALLTLTNILQDYSALLDTRKASVIRLLIIRPFAYLYSITNKYIDQFIEKTSVQYLSKSSLISNSTADKVASNYFVLRKQGSKAAGVITLTCSQDQIRVSAGSLFTVDSIVFVTSKTVIAMLLPLQDTDTVNYVKMYYIDGSYKTNIPVEASLTGYVLIPAGVLCQYSSYISGVTFAELTSPITGGDTTLTDSALMERCKLRVANSIGTKQAVSIKLSLANIPYYDCNLVGSSLAGCFTTRYNNLAIPAGSFIDAYVKTNNQIAVLNIQVDQLSKDTDNKYYAQLDITTHPQIAGALRVKSVNTPSSTELGKYTVTYGSSKPLLDAQAARGSIYQNIKIKFLTLTTSVPVIITVLYMPYIADFQDFIDSDNGSFIGQDILIKAAAPCVLRLQGQLYSQQLISELTISNIKISMSQFINKYSVGLNQFNMDNLSLYILQNYPGINMRLPYTIGVSLPKTNGSTYTFNTIDGTIDIRYRKLLYTWCPGAYFFMTTPDYIDLQVL